jgi:uncharacterized phage-associated protein
MLISREREKLVQTIVFFAHNTDHCGKVKLFKLLYLLDFFHFRATGRSVTGLEYRAWKMGPVPLELVQEWDQLEPDERVVARVNFDASFFTKRELGLMEELAHRFRDELTRPLVSFTHAERGPWDKIWDDGRGNNERIPYTLSIGECDPHAAAVLESAREYEGIRAADSRQH